MRQARRTDERARATRRIGEDVMKSSGLGGSSKRKFFASCACCEPAPARTGIPIDRRNFLSGGLAALGLGAAAGTVGAPAVKAQAAKSRIDVHHHFLPPVHREAL